MTAGCARCAAEAAASVHAVDGFDTVAGVLAEIVDELRPHECGRFDVLRTRFTEDRQLIDRGLRVLVYQRDNFRCIWCGSSSRLELDHIVPWSAGGSDTFDNLRTLCHDCNSYRSNQGFSLDLMCDKIPGGLECVHCNPDLIGDPDTRPIFCLSCHRKAPGRPRNTSPEFGL